MENLSLAEKYRISRTNKGLSQLDVVNIFNEKYMHLCGGKPLSNSYYRDIESRGRLTKHTYFLAKVLDVNPDWMLCNEGEPDKSSPTSSDFIRNLINTIRAINLEVEQYHPNADDEFKLKTYVMTLAENYKISPVKALALLE